MWHRMVALLLESSKKNRLFGKIACVPGSTICTNRRPISFKVLTIVPLLIPVVPMVRPVVANKNTDNLQSVRAFKVLPLVPMIDQ